MINQKLLDYIKKQTDNGKDKNSIKSSLLSVGWQENDIEEGFRIMDDNKNQANQEPSSAPMSVQAQENQYNYQQSGVQSQVQPSIQQNLPVLAGTFDLIGQTWSIYTSNLKFYISVLLIPYMLLFFLGLIPYLFISSIASSPVLLIILSLIITIISIFISFFAQVALLYAIVDKEHSDKSSIYRIALRKMISYAWITFLVGLITVGGFFLFIAPGVIFSIWFVFSVFIFAEQDKRGMNALLKSKEYTKGLWGNILWRYLVFASIIIGPMIIIFIIFGLFSLAMGAGSTVIGSPPLVSNILSDIFQTAVQILLTPFVLLYSYTIFNNVKGLKGNQVAEDPQGKKWPFILVGIFGTVIGIALMVALSVLLISSFGSARLMG